MRSYRKRIFRSHSLFNASLRKTTLVLPLCNTIISSVIIVDAGHFRSINNVGTKWNKRLIVTTVRFTSKASRHQLASLLIRLSRRRRYQIVHIFLRQLSAKRVSLDDRTALRSLLKNMSTVLLILKLFCLFLPISGSKFFSYQLTYSSSHYSQPFCLFCFEFREHPLLVLPM